MSQIPIQKQVFDKNQFGKVIDTEFSQLLNQQIEAPTPTFTLEDFFTLYEQLFYQIYHNLIFLQVFHYLHYPLKKRGVSR